MPALDQDSLLLRLPNLSGMHEDAVRCIYDERLNRLKKISDPADQLDGFKEATDDAYKFWQDVKEKPEDMPGRKEKVSAKISGFFDRVVRYAEFHPDENLTPAQKELKQKVIANALGKQQQIIC
jgi:hypothetical protein